jgi:hypothetical protein
MPLCDCAHEWRRSGPVAADRYAYQCELCERVLIVDVETADMSCDQPGWLVECWWPSCVLLKRDMRKRARDAWRRFRWELVADLGD